MFKVINPGVLTTVQDLGRHGYQKYGMPVSGAADPYAHRMANILVSNHQNEATLEITLMGLQLEVLNPGVIAFTGGDLTPTINNERIEMWRSITVKKGDMIRLKGGPSGCRVYLAVHGALMFPKYSAANQQIQ
ncbi:Allophanate hydrolase [Lentibacillus sp. JNUCC-1]|nr:hypothetical protein [Lentibacillus sp. JNUCC-1]MUV36755.1 Allophanate hydrolase [Lentibacillus sp. JNUCC-1]